MCVLLISPRIAWLSSHSLVRAFIITPSHASYDFYIFVNQATVQDTEGVLLVSFAVRV